MNTATTTIHKAERMLCGCKIDPKSGARYITCQAHAQTPRIEPLAKKNGLRPLCVRCASQRVIPAGINIACLDCGALFEAADLSYGLSVDSKPLVCELCNTINNSPCTCNQQTEPAP